MKKPKFLDETAEVRKDSITINWDKLTGLDAGGEGIEIIEYVIEYTQLKELEGEAFEPENKGTETVDGSTDSWKHTGIDNAQAWSYKIRAVNSVSDCEKWSPALEVVSGEPPQKPDEPTVCVTGVDCPTARRMRLRGNNGGAEDDDAPTVKLIWSKDGVIEDNITAYEVKILNGEGNFVEHPDCDVV